MNVFDNFIPQTSLLKSSLLITLLVIFLFLLFLLVRQVLLWYWKINENTENLQRIAKSLEDMVLLKEREISLNNLSNTTVVVKNQEIDKS